jgi:prepilin-type N-terminal cleavage/methylation domain-containing protein
VQSRSSRRGFTFIELMIVVVIVGVLAALATYGVRRYMATSKTAEALQNVGGMGRAVRSAATRETMSGALLAANDQSADGASDGNGNNGNGNGNGNGNNGNGNGNGNNGNGNGNGNGNNGNGNNGNGNNGNGAIVTKNAPGLCGSADPVPSSMASVTAKKYQPNAASGSDYATGDRFTGWRCLQFSIASPQYYQYRYKVDGPPVGVTLPKGGTPPGLSSDRTWSASAQGDLDGDGVTSWFVLEGYLSDKREIVQAPAIATQDAEE